MSFEADEEILQDFLVEAGEILELLSEQLVELENDPDNADLLNSIFRGFHTVKGGAGFLSLAELVDVCHFAENIFDLLRNEQRKVTSDLMDVILSALDTVNDMFALVKNREALVAADPELLAELHRLSVPESESDSSESKAEPEPEPEPEPEIQPEAITNELESNQATSSDEMTEDEFEQLLDELHGSAPPSSTAVSHVEISSPAVSNGDISDDEFESLLDELHGQGAFSANVNNGSSAVNASSDEINDDEFESLLDELHGKGQAPKATEPNEVIAAPVATPKPSVAQTQAKPKKVSAASKPSSPVKAKEKRKQTSSTINTTR